ncbi:MAG TPA: hypothetical protein PLY68_04955 [Myxococcota bacterium]|nr:hypothetical protein [Myxococcota bacterium]HPB50492.1 hypothetical protein [Myxococcota bacterium]HQP95527.1 hypothetical protein [Myxococcota bacterium]
MKTIVCYVLAVTGTVFLLTGCGGDGGNTDVLDVVDDGSELDASQLDTHVDVESDPDAEVRDGESGEGLNDGYSDPGTGDLDNPDVEQTDLPTDGDLEIDGGDPSSCADISVENVVDFGTLLQGQSLTRHVTVCNRCHVELAIDFSQGLVFDGACETLGYGNCVIDGTPVDISTDAGLLSLLGYSLGFNRCAEFDLTYDSALVDYRPALLECDLEVSTSDGTRHVFALRGTSADRVQMASDACLALDDTCAIDGWCVGAGAADSLGNCGYCEPSIDRNGWSSAESGFACTDGQVGTFADVCDEAGVCAGTSMNTPPVLTAITSSFKHNCVLTAEGRVYCWGLNDYGEIGVAPETAKLFSPTLVSGLEDKATAISAGKYHNCAAIEFGGVVCWGRNDKGQLGNGQTVDSSDPVLVSDISGEVTALACGDSHSCALLASGEVRCWGGGNEGQLGHGILEDLAVPVLVPGLPSIADISSGERHVCALAQSGHVYCWGVNDQNQLGNGLGVNSASPVEVPGITDAIQLSAGRVHNLVRLDSGKVGCWGHAAAGECGNGRDDLPGMPMIALGLNDVAHVNAHGQMSCAIDNDGLPFCWGYNGDGQLGDNSTEFRFTPVRVQGLFEGGMQIDGGLYHTCALMTPGGVKCWGSGGSGQLGAGESITKSGIPVDVIW